MSRQDETGCKVDSRPNGFNFNIHFASTPSNRFARLQQFCNHLADLEPVP
jgi:hypothetical protein